MSTPKARLQIAELRLARLGEPQPGESADVKIMRKHYTDMRTEALAAIAEAQHANLPYKDSE